MGFQAEAAEPTRLFLAAVLRGKGNRAACSLRAVPSALLEQLQRSHAGNGDASAASLQPQCMLQDSPAAAQLFRDALQRSEGHWFTDPAVLSVAAEAKAAASAAVAAERRRKRTEEHRESAAVLHYVQFVSVPQPATEPSLPCAQICNTLRPETVARDAATASAHAAGVLVPPHAQPSTRRSKLRRPPPLYSSDDEEDPRGRPPPALRRTAGTVVTATGAGSVCDSEAQETVPQAADSDDSMLLRLSTDDEFSLSL